MNTPDGTIIVPVAPVSKPVFYKTRWGGHWGSDAYKRYLKEIEGPLGDAIEEIDTLWLPLSVCLRVYCPRPKSTKLDFPKGDLDNFHKAVLDSCTKYGLWVDDELIQEFHGTPGKYWADPQSELSGGYFELEWRTLWQYQDNPRYAEAYDKWRNKND